MYSSELHEAMSMFFEKQDVKWYLNDIEKLEYRYNKFFDLLGD